MKIIFTSSFQILKVNTNFIFLVIKSNKNELIFFKHIKIVLIHVIFLYLIAFCIMILLENSLILNSRN
jgi:presenilin-like A22 family membrane protease